MAVPILELVVNKIPFASSKFVLLTLHLRIRYAVPKIPSHQKVLNSIVIGQIDVLNNNAQNIWEATAEYRTGVASCGCQFWF
jgi:hypothetical protein